jgi:hypothetical protein
MHLNQLTEEWAHLINSNLLFNRLTADDFWRIR